MNKLDCCYLMATLDKSPLKLAVEFLNNTFPGLMKRCPYNVSLSFDFFVSEKFKFNHPQGITVINATTSNLENQNDFPITPVSNGLIKTSFKFYDELDENIFTFTFCDEIFFRNRLLIPTLFENAGK
jgi:hypothetical protein